MEYNYLAILAAAIVAMVVGGLWYSPVLFGKAWMRETGKSPDTMKGMKMPAKEMSIAFIAALVVAYVLASFTLALNVQTAADAVALGLWVWVGFYATLLINTVLWEGQSWKLYFINASHYLVAIVLMALVVGLWK